MQAPENRIEMVDRDFASTLSHNALQSVQACAYFSMSVLLETMTPSEMKVT